MTESFIKRNPNYLSGGIKSRKFLKSTHKRDFKNSEVWKEYNQNQIFIFMLPKPKIRKIRVNGPISEIFWDLILPRWIFRIAFYKIVCHIIFRKIFAYLNVSNSGLFFFPFCNRSSRKIILFSFFFVTDQAEAGRTTRVSNRANVRM